MALDLITQPFAASGDVSTPPQTSASGFVNFTQGYTTDYEINLASGNPQAKAVERKVQNYLFNQLFANAQQFQQYGLAPWFSTMPGGYPVNAQVLRLNAGVWTPYRSLVANNVSDPLTTPANWEYVVYPHDMKANIPMPAGGASGSTAQVVTVATDFNTFNVSGTFEFKTDAIAAASSNAPVPNGGAAAAGMLEVIVWNNGSANYIIQQYTDRNGNFFQRSATGTSWGAWSQGANIASPALTGTPTAPTPAQFDVSTKIATMAAVQQALGNLSNDVTLAASTTLTVANLGQNVRVFGSTGVVTLTLPASSALPNAGSGIWISNLSSFNVTIATQAGDNFSVTAGTTMTLLPNDVIFFVNKNQAWTQMAGSGQLQTSGAFAKSLATNGYQKLPSGLIIQWGYNLVSASSQLTLSYPIAFPNASLGVVCNADDAVANGTSYRFTAGARTKTQFNIANNWSGQALAASWIAWGY